MRYYTGSGTDIVMPDNFRGIPLSYYGIDGKLTLGINNAIKSVIFPDSAVDIKVDFTNIPNVSRISFGAFMKSGVKALSIACPSKVGSSAFEKCGSLRTVSLNDSAVDTYAFRGCEELTEAEVAGDSVLGEKAFRGCVSLENIALADSVSISPDTFNGCVSLRKINGTDVVADGDIVPEYSELIRKSFNAADDVGFINDYVDAQVKKIVRENITPGMDDLTKVKVLHDWVCKNARYGKKDINSPEYHNDASILLNGETVCEGYARMCNLLYHEAGIETYYAYSEDHAWNIVKLGRHWFHTDSTWDDGDFIMYGYFLCSDSEFIGEGGSHAEWDIRVPSSLHSFQGDTMPECRYAMGDVNTDGELTAADLVKMSRYLISADTAADDDMILYDVDFSGRVDSFDLIKLRQKFLSLPIW